MPGIVAKNDAGKVRLLIACTSLSKGGAERDTANIANLLDRQKFEVEIALMRMVIDYPVPEDVTIHDLGKQRIHHNFRAIWRLRKLIQSKQFDVVLSSLSTTNDLTLLTTLTMGQFPYWIARIDGDPSQLGLTEPVFIKRIIKKAMQYFTFHRANALFVNSFGSRDSALEINPGCREKLTVIYNPVNLKLIKSLSIEPSISGNKRPGGVVLITTARLEPTKEIDMVLEVFARLVESGLDLSFVICGSGSQATYLKNLAKQLGISERVVFTGFVQNPYAELANADIYVLASKREGLPNALIEAQALGLPAVVTDCRSGPGEVIEHGKTGLLVPVGDKMAMASAISRLTINPELRKQYGKAAAERAAALFDQEKLTPELEEFIASSRIST